ncbi:hypothetical protein [Natrialba sp. INN-245]|uniref:DUF7509 family protein n=1 Tax=Natrialba sp. INN-245 TaxID=2690967 RepID=UPI0013103698|nr:hypothetical protein [Natrialba sp. INN-245]MWV41045.1 hypothetical protein [Natrialba sp. INN-245]
MMVKYDGQKLRDYLLDELPDLDHPLEEVLVFVMGPYTTTDLTYYYDDIDDEDEFPDSDFGAFSEEDDMHEVLEHVVEILREEIGVSAFIATQANIPYDDDDEYANEKPIVNILAQSKGYATVSDIVIFVLPFGGIRDGVDIEIGAILEANINKPVTDAFEFNSENDDKTDSIGHDGADKFSILKEEGIQSETIKSLQEHYDVSLISFDSEMRLGLQLRVIVSNRIDQLEVDNDPDAEIR